MWRCECPENTRDNGVYCITNPCQNGRVWSEQYKSCVCENGKIWDSRACVPPRIDCTNGRVWDPTVYACICPIGTFPNINKCDPVPVCDNGRRYNPLNNKCECPFSLIYQNRRCVEPSCNPNQYWDGDRCVQINCPPGTYFNENRCIQDNRPQDQCGQSEYWNGEDCRYHQLFCPFGTIWINQECRPIGSCSSGFYQNTAGNCVAIPQQCTPPTYWEHNRCKANRGSCPQNTYYSDNTCKNTVPCQNGHVWDPIYLRCTCPPGEQSNGHRCIECRGGKEWVPGIGCRCKTG